VRILLGLNDVNPEMVDKCGQRPLSFAARDGREGVVRILLGRSDVNPNTPSECVQIPLSPGLPSAAMRGS